MSDDQPRLVPEVLSVSMLNSQAKKLLEQKFPVVTVEGELGGFSTPPSGHWYMTLKDEKAQLDCVMFRFHNRKAKFTPEVGDKVQLKGMVSLFEPRGNYQLIAQHIEPAGEGELQQQFERLKRKLQEEGLFDEARKQPIPENPSVIAVITSPKAAALQDVLTVLKRRAPHIVVYLLPATVQGERGSAEIVEALKLAARLEGHYKPDVVLLTRGGGSPEDLWSFNEERVVRAIDACPLPTVSAVGHQVDFTLSDFAADMRAPTPSAAAELISPDNQERLEQLAQREQNIVRCATLYLKNALFAVENVQSRLRRPEERIRQQAQYTDILHERLVRGMSDKLDKLHDLPRQHLRRMQLGWQNVARQYRIRLDQALKQLDLVNPINILKRGYSIIRDTRQRLLSRATQVSVGDTVEAQLAHGRLECEVRTVTEENGSAKR